MADWAIPVALSALLGPGAGQLYNKEYKKAGILIAVGIVLVAWVTLTFYRIVMPYLSQDVAGMDIVQLAEAGEKIRTQLGSISSGGMIAANGLLMALWAYGIYDAYLGARRRAALKPKLTSLQP